MARVMVNFNGSADLPTGAGHRTVEFWAFVRSTSWVAENNTIFEYGVVASNQGFGLDFAARPNMDPYTNGSFDNDGALSGLTSQQTMTDQWVHFAMTWDGTGVRLFVNGTERANKTVTGGAVLATMASQLTIGGNPRGSYFNGYIDEFRIWNIEHSQAQIMATMNHTLVGNEANLTGYWKFDETTGTAAADSVTSGGHTAHNGVLMAAMNSQLPTFVASTAPLSCP